MFRKLALLACAFLLAGCILPSPNPPTPSAEQIGTEEEAVYATLLPKMYHATGYVIMETTATNAVGVEDTAKTVDYVMQNMHDVAPGISASFLSRNDKAYSFRPDLKIGNGYVLLSWDQRNEIFNQNQSGWEIFYQNYPTAPGITTLSRVGFDPAFDQALVYIGTQSNWLAGAGYYVLLKKVDGLWTIDQKVMVWVS
ncbi:MAG TPA: hypothetical protein VMC09_08245 [Anaerolineales bacterium]|nr:hypothetical protein [Anaerolineales bacterium]